MRGMGFRAAAILIVAVGTIGVSPSVAQPVVAAAPANNTPLSFGMDAGTVAQVLGTTLIYVRGRPGDEMYLALPNVKGAALSDRKDGLYLQFRRGRLTGWKGDWGSNRPCCN